MKHIITNRERSVLVGIFILVAYGVILSAVVESPVLIMVADTVSGIAVIGIAILMYPLFLGSGRILASIYLVLKWLEGLLMIAGGLLFLFPAFSHFRDVIYEGLHLYVFIICGALFYLLLFRKSLIPRFLSIWGEIAIGVLALKTLLGLLGSSWIYIDYFLVLIIANEIFLAVWLFMRGLNDVNYEKNSMSK